MGITAAMIDSREPDWVKNLTFGGVPTIVTLLDTGDLHIACDDGTLVLVERKSPDDFLNSLKDDRLFRQCTNMRRMTPWSYLIVTDPMLRGSNGKVVTNRETGWGYNAVQGALLTIQELGVFVVFAAGDQDYEACAQRVATRGHDPQLLLPPTRQPKALGWATAMLCSFPGLGPERAQALLEFAGTAKMALAALTSPDPIPGVPANVQHMARTVLELDEGELMFPLPIEPQVTS